MNNPYGHYRRHNTPAAEHMAALWKEVAREHVARSSSARRYARACHDSMDAAVRRANKAERALASAEFDAATHLADRDAAEEERDEAVQERDELRQTRRRLLGKVDQLEVKLRNSGRSAEQPRALTPDAITEDVVKRAQQRAWELYDDGMLYLASEWCIREVFTAAAFESAASKYQGDWDAFEQEPVDDYGLAESERRAHVAGWEAARDHLAQQEVTDTEVLAARDAVREVWRRQDGLGIGHVDLMEAYARAALAAAKEARR